MAQGKKYTKPFSLLGKDNEPSARKIDHNITKSNMSVNYHCEFIKAYFMPSKMLA